MEITKTEVENIEKALVEALEVQTRQLSELQLAFAGGGIGEVIIG